MPSMNVMVRTSLVVSSCSGLGKRTSGSPVKFVAKRSMHSASCR